jgi:Domain of unknown function (DUF4396)
MLIDGVMLLWFLLTALSVVFVAIDIRNTPEHPVMKWAFVLFTAYAGPIGAFLYVLGCREPLPGLHEQYVSARWRQALGSTMHCVAGDGIGILAGAVIGAAVALPMVLDLTLEYVLGFAFGWTIFQALCREALWPSRQGLRQRRDQETCPPLRRGFQGEISGLKTGLKIASVWICRSLRVQGIQASSRMTAFGIKADITTSLVRVRF